ncbi:MAG: DUF2905 domain-containing protein [Candidatus Omnitrophota bacterium]
MGMIGKSLILAGALLIAAGVIVLCAGRMTWLGRLPGDIIVRRENFTFYFPVTTCILASIVLTIVLFIFTKK